MSAGVLATTAHAEGGTPQQLSGLQDRDEGGLQDGRVGAMPRDDQPHPVALARVQAREVGAYRARARVADDADRARPCSRFRMPTAGRATAAARTSYAATSASARPASWGRR